MTQGAADAGVVDRAAKRLPSGNLFADTEGTTTTVYLPSEQLTINTSGNTLSGVRTYKLPGGVTAVRTGSGASYGFEVASDQHGTDTLYLDDTAQKPTWRQFDPFGNARGTAPASGTFPGNRGLLNDSVDTVTGLTSIGARWYDSSTGTFISLDPLLETSSQLELNGYTYAGMNPVTSSDPTGKMLICDGPCDYTPHFYSPPPPPAPAPAPTPTPATPSWENPANIFTNYSGAPAAGWSLFTGRAWQGYRSDIRFYGRMAAGSRVARAAGPDDPINARQGLSADDLQADVVADSGRLRGAMGLNKLRLPNSVGGWATSGGLSAASGLVTGAETYQKTHNVGESVAVGTASAGDSFVSGWIGSAVGDAAATALTSTVAESAGLSLLGTAAMGAEVGSFAGPAGIVIGAAVGIGIALATSSTVENWVGSLF